MHKEEKQKSADVDVTVNKQDMKLKGDPTSDDVSWKQWKEQHRKMDLHKESFHKPAGTSSQGIAKETMSHLHHPSPDPRAEKFISDDDKSLRDAESSESFRSPREAVVTGSSAETEDISNKRLDLVRDSDLNEEQGNSTKGNSSAGDSNNEEHDGKNDHSEETDRSESPPVETTAIPDHVEPENIQNVRNEQLLKAELDSVDRDSDLNEEQSNSTKGNYSAGDSSNEDSVKFASSDTRADDVESVKGGDISVSEERAGEETFEDDSDSGAEEEPAELVESLHVDHDEHEDDMQGEWESQADFLEEDDDAAAADDDDDAVHKAEDVESDEIIHDEKQSDAAAGSDSLGEKQPHSADEDIAPVQVDVLDGPNADIVLDERSTGWTHSTLGAIFSSIDAIVYMVRHRMSSCV